MANEVTKKDLADLEKKITKLINDEVAQINKAFEVMGKNDAEHTKEIIELGKWAKGELDKIVKVINDKCD